MGSLRFRKINGAALAAVLILGLSAGSACAEDITYTGNDSDLSTAPDPAGTADSLFSATSSSANTITINYSVGADPARVFGGISDAASVNDNKVFLIDGHITNNMYGAYAMNGANAALRNTITISGGAVDLWVQGGYVHSSSTGDARLNSVIVTGGAIGYNLVGGSAQGGGNAEYNEVSISGASTVVSGAIQAGYAVNGNADYNTATISGGTLLGVQGGVTSTSGNASYNTVKITGGSISQHIAGGSAETAGDTIGNIVTVSNITGASLLTISGGTTSKGIANLNQVAIDNVTFNSAAAGMSFNGGDASFNTLSAVNVTGQILMGGNSHVAAAFGNTVNFHSGTLGYDGEQGTIFGGAGTSATYGNTVNIYGGTMGQALISGVSASVYGGFGSSGPGAVYDNRVNIFAGVIGDSGESSLVYGGESSGNGTAVYNNTVTIAGGVVGKGLVFGEVYGGRQASNSAGEAYQNSVIMTGGETDLIYGGFTKSGDVYGNTISVSGGTVNDWVIGGYATGASTAARDNVVTLSGTPNLINAKLRGWLGNAATHSGNTLEVHEYNGTAVKNIGNFEIYDFLVPTSISGAALTVTEASNISDSVIRINFTPGSAVLRNNERITLINDLGGLTAGNINDSTVAGQGIALLYELDLLTDANNLYALVRSITADPQSKPLAEGQLASLAFLGQGADLLADLNHWSASPLDLDRLKAWTPFMALSGGGSRYDSGSHVDVDGFSLAGGLIWNNPVAGGLLKVGPFFEFGVGNYSTRNSFNGLDSIAGDGDAKYYGGGLIGRYELSGGLYFEALFRAGRVENGFNSADLFRLAGIDVDYEISSAYYGAQAALGYVWQLNERISLDFSTRYLWTHQNGQSLTVAGDHFDFDAADSRRWRNGLRLYLAASEKFDAYLGAAYDYEFAGKADTSVYGYSLDAPEIKGGTGIGELGFSLKPDPDGGFSFDLSLQGHIGVRDGITGKLQLRWAF